MSYVFHESRVVVIETSRRVVRAVLGLGELLHLPSVVCRLSSPLEFLQLAMHPLYTPHCGLQWSSIQELPARVGLRRSFLTSVNGSTSTPNPRQILPHPPSTVRVSDYLVGSVLDEALAAGEDVVVYWPFLNGREVSNWAQAEAVW
jgi:actin-related protein 9